MIPRYLPSVDLHARLHASRETHANASSDFVSALVPGHAYAGRLAVLALRDGLNAYFRDLAARRGNGPIVMSAQICPLVPLAARNAGFVPRFVDIDDGPPVPRGSQFAEALDSSVKGVVVAPLYGHLSTQVDVLLGAIGDRSLLLDLAQGLGLSGIGLLLSRADAVGYSFGIGKGMDTGGGLLLTRKALRASDVRTVTLGVATLARSTMLQAISACGLYRAVAGMVEHAAEAKPEDLPSSVRIIREEWVYRWWQLRLATFLREVDLARKRAAELRDRLRGHLALAFNESCFSPDATHLRQIIRLADGARRDAVLNNLRRLGVDCAAAGEPLPPGYIPGDRGHYPAARRFLADSIRLPFLGRLSEKQFYLVVHAVERAIG